MRNPRGSADIPTEGECYFCTAPCYDIDYCERCREFICSVCREVDTSDLFFKHEPEDHLRERDE